MATWTASPGAASTILGTQHYMNPKVIAEHDDVVLLSTAGKLLRCAGVAAAVLALLLGIYFVVDGIYGMSAGYTGLIFQAASAPLIGLIIGVLASALLQSSSTTTALTVAAVGTGAIGVPVAIPLILGSNIGTTLTALVASFSYVRHPEAFRQALTTAFLHPWFNALMVAVLFPLELALHPLQSLSQSVARLALHPGDHAPSGDIVMPGPLYPLIQALGTQGLIGRMAPSVAGFLCAVLGALLIFLGLRVMRLLLRSLFAATTLSALERTVGGSTAAGVATGAVGTAVIQSSTVAIVSLLPFAATRTLTQREGLALILGANVGTTVGALLAFWALPDSTLSVFALQAALVHVIFNVLGALLVLLIPGAQRGLLRLASLSAAATSRRPLGVLAALTAAYLGLPALILALVVAL